MRTFIAIDLLQETKDKLSRLQARLKKSGADVKWIAPMHMHLTLKFLGEIDEDKSIKIAGIIEDTAKKSQQFRLGLSSLSAFPKMESPRIIWVGVGKGNKEATELAQELEARTVKLGIPKEERPFSAHITIGRVSSPLNKEKLVKALKEAENYFGGESTAFAVTQITLFKSTLGSGGPIYEPLQEAKLTTT